MIESGDWLVPRHNGCIYADKPPLFYWFEAGLIRAFGLSEWSVRTGPALFALFGCLAVYYAGARMYGRAAGILSAVVLALLLWYGATVTTIDLRVPAAILGMAALATAVLWALLRYGFRWEYVTDRKPSAFRDTERLTARSMVKPLPLIKRC